MKRLHLSYDMSIEYSVEVSRCNFTIKCIPRDTLRQKISNINITISPDVEYLFGKDGLNNTQIYGVNETPHKSFNFHIDADAVTGLSECETGPDDNLDMIFRHQHGLNIPGPKIKAFYESINCFDNEMETYEKANMLMQELWDKFEYKSMTTDVKTSAEEAFVQGYGVCQDYAHIYISILHLAKIAARYVTGFIVGEGESHAWVEVLCDGKWYGFDPTHNRIINDDYIKIGIGRDAGDCMINRGIMHGGGLHTQVVTVQVNEG